MRGDLYDGLNFLGRFWGNGRGGGVIVGVSGSERVQIRVQVLLGNQHPVVPDRSGEFPQRFPEIGGCDSRR